MSVGKIPVSMITGFLGSGKTTLLNRLLQDPALRDVLVLINEFGAIGLDHHLVQLVDGDVVLMESGCLCCTIQSDLSETLHDMAVRRAQGDMPEFRRVVIETTGLADPAPIMHTLMQSSLLVAQYRLDGVISTVDAVNGASQLNRQPEAIKQAAMADRLVLTKTDLASSEQVAGICGRLGGLNPAAPILKAAVGEAVPARLFDAGLYNPQTKNLDVRRWLNAAAYEQDDHRASRHGDHDGESHGHAGAAHHAHDVNRHDEHIRAMCLTIGEPIKWERFAAWAQGVAERHGDAMLRLKAILNLHGRDRPIVVHGVQRLFHPAVELPAWPDEDRRSRVVLITRDLDAEMLERSLRSALAD